jgi:hypothetical protein
VYGQLESCELDYLKVIFLGNVRAVHVYPSRSAIASEVLTVPPLAPGKATVGLVVDIVKFCGTIYRNFLLRAVRREIMEWTRNEFLDTKVVEILCKHLPTPLSTQIILSCFVHTSNVPPSPQSIWLGSILVGLRVQPPDLT